MQLVRTGYHALVSAVATGYLDRREMQAALRTHAERPEDIQKGSIEPCRPIPEKDFTFLCLSGTERERRSEERPRDVWFDFIADIGDSWDATYATLSLMARPKLRIRGLEPGTGPGEPGMLPRGSILSIGGDLVYPTPSRENYRTRTRSALIAALPRQPSSEQPSLDRPSLVAIPGNHDWYDGLTSFVREFCQGGAIGGWKLEQRRSYFAVRLSQDWWLWGIDIALDSRIDSPQQAYFRDVLNHHAVHALRPANIILCTAKPVWLDNPKHSDDAYNNLAYFIDKIEGHNPPPEVQTHRKDAQGTTDDAPQAQVKVILSGDIHHYSRYESRKTGHQMIVAGGGGAYLAATHRIPERVLKVTAQNGESGVENKRLQSPATDDDHFCLSEYTYPRRLESRALSWRVLGLGLMSENWSFGVAVGALYLGIVARVEGARALMTGSLADAWQHLSAFPLNHAPARSLLLTGLAVAGAAAFTAGTNNGSRFMRLVWGACHGLSHIIAALWLLAWLSDPRLKLTAAHVQAALPITILGAPVAPAVHAIIYVALACPLSVTLLGAFLLVSDRLFGWHTNELFAFQSIVDFRNFLRMKIDHRGDLTIYPIGLRQVPTRWRERIIREPEPTADPPTERTHPPVERAHAPAKPAPPPAERPNPSRYEPGDAVLEPHLIEAPIVVRGVSGT